MEFDSRGSNGSTAGSVFSVLPVFPLIRSGIGSECFVGVGARCRFRPIHCSLRFGGSCPAVGVVVSFLPCSVRIERLGSLEYRTDRCFGGSTSLLTDRGAFDFFLECLQLVALRVPSQPGLVEVTANIDLLNELKDGGLTVDAELARLKEMERDCKDLVASATVPDWSIPELDFPQISEDSEDQIGGSSVPDDTASS
ncbi:hypothetical protein F2Q68_00042967 [Brassica cretica]|uniref:Uncharacterized protein n=1 Tax=Brassica cretica TaxID=69181 RepID=A0A8S9LQX6_BRACR|nr:hypothetical protein F2Q68_00042967 [Brassica cretica]